LRLRDANAPACPRAARSCTAPRFAGARVWRRLAVYAPNGRQHRHELPTLVANPRATLPYGSDSLRFYVERYSAGPGMLHARVVDGADKELWRDSVLLTGDTDLASATLIIAQANLPVGQAELQAVPSAGGDTT